MSLTVLALLPELLDANGDSRNAEVLVARARWAGLDATLVPVANARELPAEAHAIVVGSGSDAALGRTRDLLLGMQDALRRWTTDGVPLLAVGTGMELLSWGVELPGGSAIEGLGILPGRAAPRDARATGDLVVKSRYGTLVGFENHSRDYLGAEGSPLGRVLAGEGNGRGSGQEGVVMGSAFGTHLHGPILAKNPRFADHLLGLAAERAGVAYATGERSREVDVYAREARAGILSGLGIADDA